MGFFYTATKGLSRHAIAEIFELHLPPPALIADVTCGPRCGFLHDVKDVDGYEFVRSDLGPYGDVQADFRALPYRDEIFDCVLLDPPWGCVSTTPRLGGAAENYKASPTNSVSLWRLFHSGLSEAARVLRRGGICVVKGQDYVSSGKRHWISIDLLVVAGVEGLSAIDQKIMIQRSKPPRMWHQKQQRHFRANHSFYWVMKKGCHENHHH